MHRNLYRRRWIATCCVVCWCCILPYRTSAASPPSCRWLDPALRALEQRAAGAVWKANLVRSEALVHPSKAYSGVWLRDSFWTFLGLGDPVLAQQALAHFSASQLPDGQIPTQFEVFLRHPLYQPDESTLLYLIWAAWQAQMHHPLANFRSLTLALSYVRRQVHAGLYMSAKGTYASWFDGFILPRSDTLSYNQGLYAAALLAARQLRLTVSNGEIQAAVAGYRSLADQRGGYLRFSRNLAYHSISGLMGDFLSAWLFRQPILGKNVVAATLSTQPSFGSGFKVVTDGRGRPLSPHAFVSHFFAGDYQNGGSWLLFDYVALADGCMQGLPGMAARMDARLRLEFKSGAVFHEYLNTDPHSRLFGREPAYRDVFSWDTFVLRVNAVLAQRTA